MKRFSKNTLLGFSSGCGDGEMAKMKQQIKQDWKEKYVPLLKKYKLSRRVIDNIRSYVFNVDTFSPYIEVRIKSSTMNGPKLKYTKIVKHPKATRPYMEVVRRYRRSVRICAAAERSKSISIFQ